ncbi:SHOCT domain-containing protein [Cytobacillus firmus]|uniref:SHOCT domain-containing protein n=1 Tax=Cytobacillus firmus TaxID=1399 RepID=A0AA46SGS2_CYTFI|nr:SHOCT domain-containing protein [Cytobacillus firmus]UYG98093.1 SHOCT domain-containing protein [Cytobacillus firmus]
MGMMNFGMLLNMLFWILIIGFAIYGVVLLIMKPFEKNKGSDRKSDHVNALDILRERFARGEINEEEYEQKKRVLNKD